MKPKTNAKQHPLSKASSWPRVRLGDLCDLVNGDAYRDSDWSTSGVPIIRIQNLNNHDKPFNYWAGRLDDRVVVNSGDVLLAWSGTPGTSFGTHIWQRGLAVLNQHIFRVDLNKERLDPEWAVYSINEQLDEMIGRAHGAVGLRHVNKKEVQSLEIFAPPLAEQRRIAGRLREQLAAVAQARVAVRAQLDAAEVLPAAHLRTVFNGDAAKKWTTKPLIEASEISGGITLGRNMRGRATRAVPYLRVANVKDGRLDLSHVKEVEATENEIEDCRLIFGDILLTEGGDPDKLGRGTYWQEQLPECIHQNHIFRVRFDLAAFSPAFVAFQMGSPYGKAYFLAHAKQTTGIASINKTVLSKFPLLVPPFAEQCAIASQLEAEKKEAAGLTKTLTDKLTALDHLPAALLREAFGGAAGQLVARRKN